MDLQINNRNFHRKEYLIHENLKKGKINGSIRKTTWWYNNAIKGRFLDVNQDNALLFANTIDNMITSLNSIYDKNWDFHISPKFNKNSELNTDDEFSYYEFCIQILYPEITIKNSLDISHKIKNLIVCLEIELYDKNFIPIRMSGYKTTYTNTEISLNYIHSHLQSLRTLEKVFSNEKFCLGNSDLQDLFLTFKIEGYKEEFFELLLHSINSYVEWESLEGVPYLRIQELESGREENPSFTMSETNEKYICNCLILEGLDLDFSMDRFIINPTEKFKKDLKKLLIEKGFTQYIGINRLGKFYKRRYIEEDIEDIKEEIQEIFHCIPHTYIQNKQLDLIIEKSEINFFNESNLSVYEPTLQIFINELNARIYESTIRESTIAEYNKSNYAPRNIEENPISL